MDVGETMALRLCIALTHTLKNYFVMIFGKLNDILALDNSEWWQISERRSAKNFSAKENQRRKKRAKIF